MSDKLSQYQIDIFKNWRNVKYLSLISNDLIHSSEQIKKNQLPYIDSDVAYFIKHVIGNPSSYTDDELFESIDIAIRYMQTGNRESVFQILRIP